MYWSLCVDNGLQYIFLNSIYVKREEEEDPRCQRSSFFGVVPCDASRKKNSVSFLARNELGQLEGMYVHKRRLHF